MFAGNAACIASWFHCGNLRDDGYERTSTSAVTLLVLSISNTSPKLRVEWPMVNTRGGASLIWSAITAPFSTSIQTPHCSVSAEGTKPGHPQCADGPVLKRKLKRGGKGDPLAPHRHPLGAVKRVTRRESHPVEVRDNNPVRLEQRGLRVGHVMGCAVFAHNLAGLDEVRARHVREQVVFDLEVQAAHEDAHKPATANVARGKHLLGQEVQLDALVDDHHALVVGGERRTHVDTEHGHLHCNKGERHP